MEAHEHDHGSASEHWRAILQGDDPYLQKFQKYLGKLPSAPRCKLCQAPFSGPFAPLLKIAGFSRWQLNSQLCVHCIRDLDKQSGGAEILVSVLFADVRDSTTLAEQIGPTEFTNSLNGFYRATSKIVDDENGVIDHVAGDGMMALWIPAFAGARHSAHALAAGRSIAASMAAPEGLPVGVAVHTGTAFVGVVGDLGARDFTVLGDVPNTVARMASSASPGELLVSEPLVQETDLDTDGHEHRELSLKGKAAPVGVWVERYVAEPSVS